MERLAQTTAMSLGCPHCPSTVTGGPRHGTPCLADAQGHVGSEEEQGLLTVIRFVGQPAVLGVLMEVVGVALGTLLGPEVLVGPRTLLAVADLVLEHGS